MKKHFQEISYSFLVYIILLFIIIWASYGIFAEQKEPDPVKISVIVEDSNNARWTAFRMGLETAAKDKKVDLSYIPTTTFKDFQEEKNLINKVQASTEGLIISPKTAEGMDEYYDPLSWEHSLCLVESDIQRSEETDNNMIVVAPDYEKIATALMEQIKSLEEDGLTDKRVALYSVNPEQYGTITLIEKLQEDLENLGCCYLGCQNYQDNVVKLKSLEADIVIGLDDNSLFYLAKAKSGDNSLDFRLIGKGVSESCTYYLDKNIIDAMIVVDDFNMGYESVCSVADNIRNKYTEMKGSEVYFYSINSDKVHDPEEEKYLFPVVQ